MSNEKEPGFALTELMLAVTLGAIIFTIQSPERSRDRIALKEKAAIDALRLIASAQAELRSLGAIDSDNDGGGEYGYLGELAGSAPLRVYNPVTGSPDLSDEMLSPPLLPPAFRESFLFVSGNVVRVDGYVFLMFLPDASVLNDIAGIPESGPGGYGGATAGYFPYPDTCEALWCCYAWPEEVGVTGRRAFFINQEGIVLQTTNVGHPAGSPVYNGLGLTSPLPAFDAAYSTEPESPNSPTGMGAPLGNPPNRANDGNLWTPIRR